MIIKIGGDNPFPPRNPIKVSRGQLHQSIDRTRIGYVDSTGKHEIPLDMPIKERESFVKKLSKTTQKIYSFITKNDLLAWIIEPSK